MPIHDFAAEDGKTISVYVSAHAPTVEHQSQTRDGKTYRRIYAAPLAAVNSRYTDGTADDFRRATEGKRGLKVGDTWEISAEMSEKRKQRGGVDHVREQFYESYEKTEGEKHADVTRRERAAAANAKLADMGIRVNL